MGYVGLRPIVPSWIASCACGPAGGSRRQKHSTVTHGMHVTQSDLLTLANAARRLGIGRKAIHHACVRGRLASVYIDGVRFVRLRDLDAYAKSRDPRGSNRSMTSRPDIDMLTLHRVARYLGLTHQAVLDACTRGQLPFVVRNGCRYVRLADFKRYAAALAGTDDVNGDKRPGREA